MGGRISDNYGKLDRLYDEQIRIFRDTVWSLTAAGKDSQGVARLRQESTAERRVSR